MSGVSVSGRARVLTMEKTVYLSATGMMGLATPLETLHQTVTPWARTGCTTREEEDIICCISTQPSWRVSMLGKSNTLSIVAMDATGAADGSGEEALGPGGHFYCI